MRVASKLGTRITFSRFTYLELFHIPFHAHIGQIRHHVRYDLVTRVLGKMEGLTNSLDGVSAIRVARYVFVYALYANLQTGAAVPEHLAQMGTQAVIWSSLDRDADTLGTSTLGVAVKVQDSGLISELILEMKVDACCTYRTASSTSVPV